MTITPVIYDWRQSCEPVNSLFRAGGQGIAGGMTLGGAMVSNPEPGGRAELIMDFARFVTPQQNTDASWLASRITNGAVMRVRLAQSVQLVPWADLDIADTGQTWANGEAWANDALWRASPYAVIAAGASEGSETLVVDMSVLGRVLKIGHVIGAFRDGYDFAHMVMDIEYDDDDAATLTVSPPLRRDMGAGGRILFRPAMLGVCANASEVAGTFLRGLHGQFGAVRMVEALV